MSLFHEDLASIAEAQHMAASLPHSVSPEAGFVNASLGVLGGVIRQAHALHVAGDREGAAALLDPQMSSRDDELESSPSNRDAGAYHPYPASPWRLMRNDSLVGHVSNIDGAAQIARKQVSQVSPIHAETLESIRGILNGLHSMKYRQHMGMMPADYESYGDEGDLYTSNTITIKPKTESPEIGHTPRQIGR
jgi:hypothetical protein